MSNATQSLYTCTPRQTKEFIIDCMKENLVPFVRSSPGMGKSAIYAQIADELELELVDHRLSTSVPEDLTGLPNFITKKLTNGDTIKEARFFPFTDVFPIEGQALPVGKQGWLLLLDELNSAPREVQAAAYKLVLDRKLGQHSLHSHTAMGAAGNLDTDKAITNPIGTALQSRMVHLEMRLEYDDWLMDVALKEDYDPRIVAFLSWNRKYLMDFSPDHKNQTFCCPRTWEFMNRLVRDKPVEDRKVALYGGTITPGVAAEFIQFTKVMDSVIKIEDVVRDPENIRIPDATEAKWATTSHLADRVDKDTFTDVCTYINRMTLDFRVLFFRSILIRKPDLRMHPAFAKAGKQLGSYLYS